MTRSSDPHTHRSDDFPLRGEDGKYVADVILDFDYWAAIPI